MKSTKGEYKTLNGYALALNKLDKTTAYWERLSEEEQEIVAELSG